MTTTSGGKRTKLSVSFMCSAFKSKVCGKLVAEDY
jgi:hypothetical protein